MKWVRVCHGTGNGRERRRCTCLEVVEVEPIWLEGQWSPLKSVCSRRKWLVNIEGVFLTSFTLDMCFDVIRKLLVKAFSRKEVGLDAHAKWISRSHSTAASLCTNIESKVQGTTLQIGLIIHFYCRRNISLASAAELTFLKFLLCSNAFLLRKYFSTFYT